MDERLLWADTIVFDVGNVLLTFEPEKVAALMPEEIRDGIGNALFAGRLWSKFDLGAESNEAIGRQAAAAAGVPDQWEWPVRLLSLFPATMHPLPLYGLIPELKALGKRLYALTNYPEPSFTLTCRRFPHLGLLDGAAVSSREKLAKPDPAFFRLLLERYGIDPARALFIDDLKENAASAAALGFRAWHYSGDDRL